MGAKQPTRGAESRITAVGCHPRGQPPSRGRSRGVRGGLLAALVSSVAYVPHIHTAWAHNAPYTVSQYAELVVFVMLGLFVGLIASHERRLANRYRQAAESLEAANRDLRESGEQLRRAERLSAGCRGEARRGTGPGRRSG